MAEINTTTVRSTLHTVRDEMSNIHIGDNMHEIIEGGIFSMLAKSHMLLYGEPGLDKSRVLTGLMRRVRGAELFELAGSRYANKEDLVGPLDMKAIDDGRYIRNPKGRIQEAHFAFIDETLECGDALVKELHPVLNERKICVEGKFVNIPLISAFGATNVSPDEAFEGKKAYLDRWLLRIKLPPIKKAELIKKIVQSERARSLVGTQADKNKAVFTLEELAAAQTEVSKIDVPETIDDTVCKIFKKLITEGIALNPRRMVLLYGLVKASAWFNDRSHVDGPDLDILKHVLWNRDEDIDMVTKTIAAEAKTTASLAQESVSNVRDAIAKWQKAGSASDQKPKLQAMIQHKLVKLSDESERVRKAGRDSGPLEKAFDEIQKLVAQMRETKG